VLTLKPQVLLAMPDNVAALFFRLELALRDRRLESAVAAFLHLHELPGMDTLKQDVLRYFEHQLKLKGDPELYARIKGAKDMGIFAHDLENYLKELKQEAVKAHLQGIQKGRV